MDVRICGGLMAVLLVASLVACQSQSEPPVSERADASVEASARSGLGVALHPDALTVHGLDAELIHHLRGQPPDEWADYISVRTEASLADSTLPPVLGRVTVNGAAVRFTPRFPWVPGVAYRVRVDAAGWHAALGLAPPERAVLDTFVVLPAVEMPPTVVTGVYPSSDTLPMNLLKFYLHFSAPMAEGRAFDHAHLVDETTGKRVEMPFIRMEPELWDPSRQRLTLLFDPGRIKREVGPNVDVGVALEAGRRYTLVVDSTWTDARGKALGTTFQKSFHVAEADRTPVDPADWQIEAPSAGTTESLVVHFPESLDHALLQRLLTVKKEGDTPVEGIILVSEHETRCAFTPTAPWDAGSYELHVETILEDVAGNNLRSVFDVDLTHAAPSEEREAEAVQVLSFAIRHD